MPKKINKVKKQVINKVSNCSFYGVKWDEPSLEVLKIVANGLNNLTELFKSQNVEIKSLLQINDNKK